MLLPWWLFFILLDFALLFGVFVFSVFSFSIDLKRYVWDSTSGKSGIFLSPFSQIIPEGPDLLCVWTSPTVTSCYMPEAQPLLPISTAAPGFSLPFFLDFFVSNWKICDCDAHHKVVNFVRRCFSRLVSVVFSRSRRYRTKQEMTPSSNSGGFLPIYVLVVSMLMSHQLWMTSAWWRITFFKKSKKTWTLLTKKSASINKGVCIRARIARQTSDSRPYNSWMKPVVLVKIH